MSKKRSKNKCRVSTTSFLLILILFSVVSLAVIELIDSSEYYTANVLEVDGTVVTIGHGCIGIVAETSPERAYSIELLGEFAKLGISTALPREFYDDILISDYLERM